VDLVQNQIGGRRRLNNLETEVEKLKAQRSKDSHNSSKPPSTDIKRTPKSLRGKTNRPSGGQPGHAGQNLQQVEKPDDIVAHQLKGKCERCRRSLKMGKLIGFEKRQEFDIPPLHVMVTEHQAEIRECACGLEHTAQFPSTIKAPVQYGPRIRALLVYLAVYQLVPMKRMCEMMSDIFNVPISEGTVNNVIQRINNRLGSIIEQIKNALTQAPVAHVDETGIYIAGKRWWQHLISTKYLTYLFCHPNRGKKAIEDCGVLKRFIGRLIHDGWPAYFDLECLHGLCNAHHLRELVFVHEQLKQRWAGTLIELLCRIKKSVDNAKASGRQQLSQATLTKYQKRYDQLIRIGYRANPQLPVERQKGQRGRTKNTVSINLLNRLCNHKDMVLAFMYDFRVPFDNNSAERDLRMSKAKQKISGCFRSVVGAEAFCNIKSFISSLRKQKLNVFNNLVACFTNSQIELNIRPE
jgi:transposase